MFVGAIAFALATPARAQIPELPTLSGMGLEYLSATGFFQVTLSGQIDFEGYHVANEWEDPSPGPNRCDVCHVDIGRDMRQGQGNIRAHRLRFFVDVFLGDHLYSLIEVRHDRGLESFNDPMERRLEQGFVTLTTSDGLNGVQVGRFANPFGGYVQRHLTTDDYFLRAPLMYDYRTVLNRWRVPGDAAGLLAWKDSPEDVDLPGAPPVWEVPYQTGGMAFARLGPVDWTFALMNSAVSSHPNAWNSSRSPFDRTSYVATGRWAATPALELGASYSRGGWLEPPMAGTIGPNPANPSGPVPSYQDFDQEVVSIDATFARGPYVVRAEAMRDVWEVPNLRNTTTEFGYSIEAQRDLLPGLWIAARAGHIDFRPIADPLIAALVPGGTNLDWDHDVTRIEGALGYRLTTNAGLVFSAYRQIQEGDADGDTTFGGLRMWWAF